jgi:hypothetical protein
MHDLNDNEYYEYVYDEDDNPHKVLKEQSPYSETDSGFTTYDTSHGHCAFCGSISCNGRCFR